MWESGGDKEDSGSGDYEYFDNETSSVQFSFTNVENNRSEESVIELPGIECATQTCWNFQVALISYRKSGANMYTSPKIFADFI